MGVLAIGHELGSERSKRPGGRRRERGLWLGLPGAAKIGFAVIVAVSWRWQLQEKRERFIFQDVSISLDFQGDDAQFDGQ